MFTPLLFSIGVSSSNLDKAAYNMCSYYWILHTDVQHVLEVATWNITTTMARHINWISQHVVWNGSLNFHFIARSMLGGWVILMLAKRQTALQTLLVALSWQWHICPRQACLCVEVCWGTWQWDNCVWAAASDYAKFSAALPKPACAAVRSPGCCQVCLWTDFTSLLSCLSRQSSKRAHSSGPYAGPSLAVWPPVSVDCTIFPFFFPPSL